MQVAFQTEGYSMKAQTGFCLAVLALVSWFLPCAMAADKRVPLDIRKAAIDLLRTKEAAPFPAQGVKLTLTSASKEDLKTWHFRTGVPFAFGALNKGDKLRLLRGDKEIPFQSEVLATWAPTDSEFGKAVKWLGLDFVDAVKAGEKTEYRLVKSAATVQGALKVTETDRQIKVNNGRLELVFNKAGGFNLFESVKLDGKSVLASGKATGAYLVDGKGRKFLARNDKTAQVKVEMAGPLAAVIRAEGWFVNPQIDIAKPGEEPASRPDGGLGRFVTRIYIGAGQSDVRVQHTFIITEDTNVVTYDDIGISLPVAANAKAVYGGVTGEHAGHTYLLQESWDKFTVNRIAGNGVTQIAEGQKPEGWIAANGIAAGVRDFWQNFPKELEVNSKAGEMRIHMWPGHGAPRKETAETLTDKNAWQLPWIHSGKQLNMRAPEILKDKKTYRDFSRVKRQPVTMYMTNAMGVAKTHDMLISWEPEQFAARMKAFNINPHPLANPHYTAATEVFGQVLASDTEKRPLVEHRFTESMKFLVRHKDIAGSFGMWNYGDLHTSLKIEDGKVLPTYYRLWGGPHYNYPRIAWWLYWRTGDPAIGRHAYQNSRHIMDVDIAHWTNKIFKSEKTPKIRRKMVGGMCKYNSIVHWDLGAHANYNSATDIMLYDYYFTGNRRAWDVAMEHGYLVNSVPRSPTGRGSAGPADALIELYKATWDPKVKEQLQIQLGLMLSLWPENHPAMKLDWTPWIQRLWDLTHDPVVRDYLVHWVEGGAPSRMQNAAYAYYATGDQKYADMAARWMFEKKIKTVVRDDKYNGVFGRSMFQWSIEMVSGMLSLKAAEAGELDLGSFQPKNEWPYWVNWGISIPYTLRDKARIKRYFYGHYPWPDDVDDKSYKLTAMVYHDGSPKRLWLGVQNMAAKPGADVRLFSPDGKLLKTVELRDFDRVIRGADKNGPNSIKKIWPERYGYPRKGKQIVIGGKAYDFWRTQVLLEIKPRKTWDDLYAMCSEAAMLGKDDPKGFYKVVYTGEFHTPVPILPPNGKVWLKVGKESTMEINGVQYFYVPKDVTEFTMSFLPSVEAGRFNSKLRMAAGVVVNPDCKSVATINCGLARKPDVVKVEVPPQHRGKVWAVAGSSLSIVKMENIPPYISPSFDAMQTEPFVPDIK
jgi:PcRGLX-like protein central beta sandwich domain